MITALKPQPSTCNAFGQQRVWTLGGVADLVGRVSRIHHPVVIADNSAVVAHVAFLSLPLSAILDLATNNQISDFSTLGGYKPHLHFVPVGVFHRVTKHLSQLNDQRKTE